MDNTYFTSFLAFINPAALFLKAHKNCIYVHMQMIEKKREKEISM